MALLLTTYEHCFTHRKELKFLFGCYRGENLQKKNQTNRDEEWIFDARIAYRINGQKNLNYRNLETTECPLSAV